MHVDTVFLMGSHEYSAKERPAQMVNFRHRSGKISIVVSHLNSTDAKLVVNTVRPGKPPLEFDIGDLRMKDIGPDQPIQFEANLINPKPVGDIQSSGLFGPVERGESAGLSREWQLFLHECGSRHTQRHRRHSFLDGSLFGKLGPHRSEWKTETPDFHLAVSGHRVPLHTEFHAIVDGTDGDTYLDPVNARVLNSTFTAKGKVVRMKTIHGHDIEMNVVLDRARIQDMFMLGVKTDPPLMSGAVEMKASLHLQPGEANITDRLKLAGTFHIPAGHFSNEKIQRKIDTLSLRSSGKPKLAQDGIEMNVPSDLEGTFKMTQGILAFSFLHFQIPGTHADMTGQYSLDGNTFDFHGTLKLDAKLSQMTTGWKSILLRPVDPFFHKNGAGTEVPFKIDGTKSEPHFGLDFHHKKPPSSKNYGETATSDTNSSRNLDLILANTASGVLFQHFNETYVFNYTD